MQIGVIGPGRMGGNITRRLLANGHQAAVFDRDPKAVELSRSDGAAGAAGLDKLVAQLKAPRAIWLTLPAGRIASAMRKGFGAHVEPKDPKAKPS
jgi:6-phosphogluconate dehydrogenase